MLPPRETDMGNDVVTISVHQRLDEPGYVVRVTQGDWLQKFPCPNFHEATELAESVRDFVKVGLPVGVLFGEDEILNETAICGETGTAGTTKLF